MNAIQAFKPQVLYSLGEGHSRNQETSQAYLRGVTSWQVQPDFHAGEYSHSQVKSLVVVEMDEMYKAYKQKLGNPPSCCCPNGRKPLACLCKRFLLELAFF